MTHDSSSRRAFLRGVGGAGAVAGLASTSGCLWMMGIAQRQPTTSFDSEGAVQFASQAHRVVPKMATHIADTRSSLLDGIATPGATVWIPEDAVIDMTGQIGVPIAPNVTIASNRALGGGEGGLLKSDGYENGIFRHDEGNCRVTGVRIQGPRTDRFEITAAERSKYAAACFELMGDSMVFDHNEAYGWTFAAIKPGGKHDPTQGWVHHNQMHHNQMKHLGYPMDLINGEHLIEWNYFNSNRHSIAGFGRPENAFEARFNVVGPDAYQWAFDMHALSENIPGVDGRPAGRYVNIHHNVFEVTEKRAFVLRGQPSEYARFAHNWTAAPRGGLPGTPVYHAPYYDNLITEGNAYQAVEEGRAWLEQAQVEILGGASSGAQNASENATDAVGNATDDIADEFEGIDFSPPGNATGKNVSAENATIVEDEELADATNETNADGRLRDPFTGVPLTIINP